MFQFGWLPSCLRKIRLKRGFPHSETAGSQVACHLPDVIADGHVLLRLKQPRHPLSALFKVALIYLTFLLFAGILFTFQRTLRLTLFAQGKQSVYTELLQSEVDPSGLEPLISSLQMKCSSS